MRLQVFVVVVLTVTTAGCAVSNKTQTSHLKIMTPETKPLDGCGALHKGSLGQYGLRHYDARFAELQTLNATDTSRATVTVGRNTKPADEPPAGDDFDLLDEELTEHMAEIADPLEGLNRIMFGINDTLYFWVAKPVTQVYKAVAPEPVRICIGNFFHNLTTPVRFVNCHLQGKVDSADIELKRFIINTTSGILGFGDPARDKMGLEPVEEDLGQTLAVHGFGNGFYIVWPLLGPSTLRDTVGFAGDQFLNPVRYVEPWELSIGISGTKIVNESSFYIGEYETFKSSAIDPYVAMRQAYIQYRNRQIRQ
jgi:phospholipid-binding lipoprotein MlaA